MRGLTPREGILPNDEVMALVHPDDFPATLQNIRNRAANPDGIGNEHEFRVVWADGTIRHIRASIDPAALGRTLEAQIEVKLQAETAALDFENALRHMPQVLGATLMTGSFDYAVRVACTDRDELMQITELLRQKAGVRDTYTRLVLREVQLNLV